jgi:hypothetical protein
LSDHSPTADFVKAKSYFSSAETEMLWAESLIQASVSSSRAMSKMVRHEGSEATAKRVNPRLSPQRQQHIDLISRHLLEVGFFNIR